MSVDELTVLLTWGEGRHGALGHGTRSNEMVPRLCLGLAPQSLRTVACGPAYTLVLATNGDVFSFGAGESGVLGHGQLTDCHTPKLVRSLRGNVVTLACGERNTLWSLP